MSMMVLEGCAHSSLGLRSNRRSVEDSSKVADPGLVVPGFVVSGAQVISDNE
jgi:hypothetical protein